jgi:hypothetical protein
MKIPPIVKRIQNYSHPEINYAYQKNISYSQFSIFKECPHKWELLYKDKLRQFSSTIHTVFGTAMHEALQNYITIMFEQSAAEADRFNIEEYFEERFRENYLKEYKANNSTHFSSSVEMKEFFDDGLSIIEFFKKKRGQYFSKRGWFLVACELPIIIAPDNKLKNVLYQGYLDLVLYHEPTNTFKIIDFKTSTRGWNEKTKKDEGKQFQLILYKNFFSKQFEIPEDNIEVEFFILKRKIWEESEYPQSRIQEFSPPSGKIKMKKALTALNEFIEHSFNQDGSYKDTNYPIVVNENCKYCQFKDRQDLCSR